MRRDVAAFLLLIIVWHVVGVGYVWHWPSISVTDHVHQVSERKQQHFGAIMRSAQLSGSNEQTTYESLVFVGDVLLARNVEYLMRSRGIEYPFAGIQLANRSLKPAIIGNFEATVPIEHVPTPVGRIDFSVATSMLPALNSAGFTHLSLGNNHSKDFGQKDFVHTRTTLQRDFDVFGSLDVLDDTSVAMIDWNEYEIALIGINATRPLDDTKLKRVFHTANLASDLQIVYVHWGEEYALRHNKNQTELATRFVAFGADLIVGHHPHVVQGIDLIQGVPVFYSLGNYVFDQYFSQDVQEGLVISLTNLKKPTISLLPVTSEGTLSQPHLMTPDAHAEFLATLARKSHPELMDYITAGKVPFGLSLATNERIAMMQSTYVQ